MKSLSAQDMVTGTGIIVSANIIRALLRLLQFSVIAFKFGASFVTDAYLVAQTIPFIFRGITQNALGSSAVPVLIDLHKKKSEKEAWLVSDSLFTLTSTFVFVLGVLVALTAPALISVLAPGFSEGTRSLAVTLIRLMVPVILFVGLSTVPWAVLHSYQHFTVPALTSLFLSLGVICFTLMWAGRIGIAVIPLGAIAGVFIEFLVLLSFTAKKKRWLKFSRVLSTPGVRQVARLTTPRMLGLTLVRVNLIVDRIFASTLGEGYISALTYADRLVQIPAMIVTSALGEVMLPRLSHHASEGEVGQLCHRLWRSLSVVGFFVLPLATVLVLLHEPIIRVCFQRGVFDANATRLTGVAVLFYGIGIPALSFNFMMRVFFWHCRTSGRR